ncbi:ArnT family glycosyltransferase [Aquihabitans sp. McL0605]|uniref:ArnT family glycosyltransferase n=1 Tax=Aquihabitans sp. McL0605 TaxID=3415671 RepID=UPI003CF962AF
MPVRRWEVAALVALIALLLVGNGAWIVHHRSSAGVDSDEVNLINQAEDDRLALHEHPTALLTWPNHELAPSAETAPAVPIAAGISMEVFGHNLLATMLPILAATGVLVAAAWAVARQLGARSWSLLAAAVVGVAPVTVWFSRSHHHIVPAAACFTACVAIGLRTRRLERRGWSVALGVAIGCTVLVRTMLVVIAPWALVAWVIVLLARRPVAPGRWVNVALAGSAAVVVASWWWAIRYRPALHYLLHGPVTSDAAPWWDIRLEVRSLGQVVTGDKYANIAWIAVILLVALLAACLLANVRRRWLRLEDAYVLLVLVPTFGALILAKDDFPGFFLLVAGPAIPWAISVAVRAPWRVVRRGSLALWAALALLGAFHFGDAERGWYPVQAQRPATAAALDGSAWDAFYARILDEASVPPDPGCTTHVIVPQGDPRLAYGNLRWALLVQHGAAEQSTRFTGLFDADQLETRAADARREGAAVVLLHDSDETQISYRDASRAYRRAGLRRTSTTRSPDGWSAEVWRSRTTSSC